MSMLKKILNINLSEKAREVKTISITSHCLKICQRPIPIKSHNL